jgi:chromosome partitioning protein
MVNLVKPKVLAVISQKGGSGKTPCALAMAVLAVEDGRSVAVVDLDPQATAANWGDRRTADGPSVVSCQVSRLASVLEAAAREGAEFVVIDTPGKATEAAIAAAKVADFVLIPCRPLLSDIETLGTVKDILTLAGNPPSCVVVTQAPVQGQRHLETAEAARAAGFEVSPVVTHLRNAHGDAANIGQTPTEYDPRGKAAEELRRLYSYICSVIYEGENSHGKHAERRA